MKILNISLDKKVLQKESSVAKRIIEYGNLVEQYDVVVCAGKEVKEKLSDKVGVFGVSGGSKIIKLLNCYSFTKKVLKNGYDLITVQDQYYLGLIGLLLARKFKIGLELQIHGFEKYSGLRKIIAKLIIPRAESIRCVSQRLKKQLIDEFGTKEEKITVVPVFTKIRNQELGIRKESDKIIFLTVGRLVPVKNISLQIRALSEVIKKHKNIELLIAGDGIESRKLKVESRKLKVENNVKFLGWVDSLEKYYSQADVFLLTSNYEGWGLAVIEAAMYGLPIIMTDVGCAGEMIKDNDSGLVIPIRDQRALEEAMIRLIEDKDLRNKISQNAKKAIEKLPSNEETLNLYKESWNKSLIQG